MGSERLPAVSRAHIINALKEVGVAPSDIVLVHSSLKSFGYVTDGALAVIDALKETITEQGTVVFPTLVQQDFPNAYRNWDIGTSPSDVGHISETFRLLPDSIRSDQATHSVAAWGSKAAEITGEHSAYGPRMGVFGDYCFSYSSPWQKMYLQQARIVFIGIDMVYNTFKHFAEYLLMEHYCSSINDPAAKCLAMSKIARYGVPGVWPFHDARKTQSMLDELGFISYAKCGNSLLTSIKADDYIDNVLRVFLESPANWFNEAFLAWIKNDVIQPGSN
ncbi:AAC(3) family N-acetyltransferase [Paenibacillus sp. PAMC21692]|uniref:AAC(3) family N-acetyltransferase n=1 Tax=Paenibacillus sp. PAMC21692 TaxID=2762320 RepID=UPI00164CE741|nr:AAC(3) family N-acetyltransferase [Paenibacillus sp. PAMC21692]QNK58954.1 AAC(3) family N-acetyltransferase [Paenibacillus sp. PAMC21692]